MPEERLSMRVDERTKADLAWLTERLNLTQTMAVRMALRELRRHLEAANHQPPPREAPDG